MKRTNKRIISLLLVALMLLGIVGDIIPALPVSAAIVKRPIAQQIEIISRQPGDYTVLSQYSLRSVADQDQEALEEAADALRDGMKTRENEITIDVFLQEADPSEAWNQVWNMAMEHTGDPKEGDYLSWHWSACGGGISGYSSAEGMYLTFTYTVSYYTDAAQETALDAAVEELLVELDLWDATDYEKVCGIYDYMCHNIAYDHDNLEDDTYELKHSAYAALVNETAVCQGYALLFYRLALSLGVDARFIGGTGNGGGHAWNIVKLDNQYYNLDATWDRSWYEAGLPYEWFLRSNENFPDHLPDEEYLTEEFLAAYPISETDYAWNDSSVDTCDHIWDDATCTAPKTCSLCGATEGEALNHDYTTVVTEVTCTRDGYTTYTCSICGDSYRDDYVFAEGHTPWLLVTTPTFDAPGEAVRNCERCGLSETKVLSQKSSCAPWDNLTDALSDALYRLDYFYSLDMYYMIECTNGYFLNDLNYEDRMTVPADVYMSVLKMYFAVGDDIFEQLLAQCGDEDWNQLSYDEAKHAFTLRNSGGFGGFMADREFVGFVQNGDTYDVFFATVRYAWLCDALPEGVDEYAYAESLGWPDTIEYEGIVYQPGPDGYYAILGMEDYGRKYTVELNVDVVRIISCVEYTAEDLPEHLHYQQAVKVEPTCSEQGYTGYLCSCGYGKVMEYTDALSHNWDDGVVTVEPTVKTEGVKTYTCQTCGETKTETLPKKPGVQYDVPEDDSVTIPENDCFEDGTTVTVEEILTGDLFEQVAKVMEQVAETYVAFEFTATKGDTEVQPNGNLLVTFAIPEGYSDNIAVYYMADDGTLELLLSNVDTENRTVSVELTHFSAYIVVDLDTKVTLKGDLDLDGDVDAEDLTILARHVAGIEVLTDTTALANADVNGDGSIDANDLTMHARFVAGIINEWEDNEA